MSSKRLSFSHNFVPFFGISLSFCSLQDLAGSVPFGGFFFKRGLRRSQHRPEAPGVTRKWASRCRAFRLGYFGILFSTAFVTRIVEVRRGYRAARSSPRNPLSEALRGLPLVSPSIRPEAVDSKGRSGRALEVSCAAAVLLIWIR